MSTQPEPKTYAEWLAYYQAAGFRNSAAREAAAISSGEARGDRQPIDDSQDDDDQDAATGGGDA